MPEESPPRRTANRRACRRVSMRESIQVECRRGSLGLGRDLTAHPLDLSETGVQLVLRAPLAPGEEADVLLTGSGLARPLKRLARVVWCLPTEGGHVVGLRFDKPLSYADLTTLARPPRVRQDRLQQLRPPRS
jgi:hypothetical protein